MEFIFEIVPQFFGEVFLQVVFKLLIEVGWDSLGDGVRKPRGVFGSTIGFLLSGAVAGGISLLIFPQSLIPDGSLRAANLVVSPLAAGGIMMLIGHMKDRNGFRRLRLDRFGYAFVFALAMATIRFVWAE